MLKIKRLFIKHLFVDQIEIKPSNLQHVKELFGFGGTSTNNVVDATNLVMYELGLPLHAFDAQKIEKTIRIIVDRKVVRIKAGAQ